MSAFLKPLVLTVALVAGAAAPAFAQSTSIAALPPGNQEAPQATTVPLGPSVTEQAFPTGPRNVWNDMASMHPAVASPFIGPAPSSEDGDNSGE